MGRAIEHRGAADGQLPLVHLGQAERVAPQAGLFGPRAAVQLWQFAVIVGHRRLPPLLLDMADLGYLQIEVAVPLDGAPGKIEV